MTMVMKKKTTIKASEFKAKCLKIMDQVAKSGEPVTITKNGKPVSKLVPVDERPKTLIGALKGTGEILGDIISPIDVTWEAEGAGPRHARARLDYVGKPFTGRHSKKRNRKRTG
jgi:prevent-host-death family protein